MAPPVSRPADCPMLFCLRHRENHKTTKNAPSSKVGVVFMTVSLKRTTMNLHLGIKGRSGRMTLVNDWEVRQARSLRITRSFREFPLEDQRRLAKKLSMCPRVISAATGLRICGKSIKPSGHRRNYCGLCKEGQPPIPELGAPVKHPGSLWVQESSVQFPVDIAVETSSVAVGSEGELSDCRPEKPLPRLTICKGPTVHIEPMLGFIVGQIWPFAKVGDRLGPWEAEEGRGGRSMAAPELG